VKATLAVTVMLGAALLVLAGLVLSYQLSGDNLPALSRRGTDLPRGNKTRLPGR